MATDEHGTPAELAAAKAGQPVAQYCAEMHEVQSKIAAGFRLSFDHFGRSSSAQNHRLTQFAGRLAKAGLIRAVRGNRCIPTDGRYLPDRYMRAPVQTAASKTHVGITATIAPNSLIQPI